MKRDAEPLSVTHPDLAKELVGTDPRTISQGSVKKFLWRCELGHEWISNVNNRTANSSACPFCSGHKVLPGFNDLATTHPELAKELIGTDPKTISKGHRKKLKWKCSMGHEWIVSVSSRSIDKTLCPFCSGNKVLAGFNDLATTHPELAKELIGTDPRTISKGTNKKHKWRCTLGHEWNSPVGNRVSGSYCPFCSGNKVLAGFNDLATTHPELAKELVNVDPSTISRGSTRRVKWKCVNGHVWITQVLTRSLQKSGCPTCAHKGFDPNLQAYLYFLIQPKWELYQIGITNQPDKRLIQHKRNGFQILDLRGPMDGHTARELETSLLRYLREQKAELSPNNLAGKFDGYSESWTIDSFKVNNLKELIDKASEVG